MNQKQREYAKGRVNEIKRNAKDAVREHYKGKERLLTHGEILKQIQRQKPRIMGQLDEYGSSRMQLASFFSFKCRIELTSKETKERDRKLAVIDKEANRLIDEILLGTAENAVEKISAFEKKYIGK